MSKVYKTCKKCASKPMKSIVFQKQKQIQQTIKSISSQNLTKTRKHVLGSSRQENLSLAIIVLQIDLLD